MVVIKIFKKSQLTKGICQVILTDWKEISEMPQRTEENLSSCLNWWAAVIQDAPTDWGKLAGNIQYVPTVWEKFAGYSNLFGKKYPRFPNRPWEICQVVSTDWQELCNMPQLTEINLFRLSQLLWQEISKIPQLTKGNLASCPNWLVEGI